MWIKPGFVIEDSSFNPYYAPDRQKPGPLIPKEYNDAMQEQRSRFLSLFEDSNNTSFIYGKNVVAIIARNSIETKMKYKSSTNCSIVPFNSKSEPKCQIQINYGLPIFYGNFMLPTFETIMIKNPKKKIIALGVPLATRKEETFKDVHLKKFLLNSLLKTITEKERKKFHIIIYIAYDEGDPSLDSPTNTITTKFFLEELSRFVHPYRSFLTVKFYKIPPIQRVATIWNILYAKAVKEGMDYFYQLNDDIEFQTTSWATKLTEMLDKTNGYGVAGPSDQDNDWNCRVLTQAMVTAKHYSIFNGLLYPTEFINWKSDRWLTQLYRRYSLTHCSLDIKIRNGNHKTRYNVCDLTSTWKNYLFEGRTILDAKDIHKKAMKY